MIFSGLCRPPPPVVGKVTHHSIELYWDEAVEQAMASADKSEGRIRVCLQEHDKNGEWGNLYSYVFRLLYILIKYKLCPSLLWV